MSKRPFDPNKLTKELSGASSFFKGTSPAAPAPASKPESMAKPAEAPSSTPVEPRAAIRPVRAAKRQMIRHPFELYMDQLEQLRAAAQAERQQGGPGSMSKMVRDAIDQFLAHLAPQTD